MGVTFHGFQWCTSSHEISTHKKLWHVHLHTCTPTVLGNCTDAWCNMQPRRCRDNMCACGTLSACRQFDLHANKVKENSSVQMVSSCRGNSNLKRPLSSTVPQTVLIKVNKEMKNTQEHSKKSCGSYGFFTSKDKARVGKYGSKKEVLAATCMRHFRRKLEMDLKESTERDWSRHIEGRYKSSVCPWR